MKKTAPIILKEDMKSRYGLWNRNVIYLEERVPELLER